MIQLPNDVQGGDIHQWLADGYVLLDKDTLCAFHDTDYDGLSFYDLTDREAVTGVRHDRVWLHWPVCGSVNIPGRGIALHCHRRQLRQWRRTFNVRGIDVKAPGRWLLMKRGIHMATNSHDIARACFYPHYPTLDTALEMLASQEAHSVAINPQVIITGGDEFTIYYRGELAARLVRTKLVPVGKLSTVRRVARALGGRYEYEGA